MDPITVGTTLTVTTGNQRIGLKRGQRVTVEGIKPLGRDFSHFVNVTLRDGNGRRFGVSTRYESSLARPVLSFGNGDGINTIKAERV